jgi:MATE family, multidrug efflux pump
MIQSTHPETPLSWSGHIRATFALGLPLIGSNLAQMLTNTTDVVMLGWYGVEELAATVLATQLYFVLFIVGAGFAFAVMPMVANALGADDEFTVRRSVRMGLWISVIYGAAAMIPLWYLEPILLFLGQKPALTVLAGDYMRIAQWGMFPMILIMLMKSYLSALERAQVVLWATVAGALANGVFNYMLIFGNWGAPELGVEGAAISSVLTLSLSFTFLVVYAGKLRELKKYTLFQRLWNPDWPAFGAVFRLGWPIGLTMLAESGLFAATSLMLGWVGTMQLATHGIVIQIASLSFMIPLGLSNVATIRVGRALGRGDATGLWRASVVVLAVALTFSFLAVAVFLSLPRTLIGLFLDSGDADYPRILNYGVGLLMAAAAFQVADSMQVVAMGLLRGIRDTAGPMVLAVVSYWIIGMPVAYVFGFYLAWGGVGVWSGLVVGLSLAAITMMSRYYRRLKALGASLAEHPATGGG